MLYVLLTFFFILFSLSGSLHTTNAYSATMRINSSTYLNNSRHKSIPKNMLHVLSISEPVTKIKWRPPANKSYIGIDGNEEDQHEPMLAVAAAPIKGASAGGSGMLALWSYHRPCMALSIVEGHKEGGVTDFCW